VESKNGDGKHGWAHVLVEREHGCSSERRSASTGGGAQASLVCQLRCSFL